MSEVGSAAYRGCASTTRPSGPASGHRALSVLAAIVLSLILVAEPFHVIIRNGSRIMKTESFSRSCRSHAFGKLADALELDRLYFPDTADLQKFLSCTVIES